MILDNKKGVNPFLSVCPRCGKDTGVVLVGKRDIVTTCANCGTRNYGSYRHEKCGGCRAPLRDGKSRKLEEQEKLPGAFCEECLKEAEVWEEEVKRGGVYWRCKCGCDGVFKADSEVAVSYRQLAGKPAPEVLGVSVKACLMCSKEKTD